MRRNSSRFYTDMVSYQSTAQIYRLNSDAAARRVRGLSEAGRSRVAAHETGAGELAWAFPIPEDLDTLSSSIVAGRTFAWTNAEAALVLREEGTQGP